MEKSLPDVFQMVSEDVLRRLSYCSEIIVAGQFSKTRNSHPQSIRLVVLTDKYLVYYADCTRTHIKRFCQLTFQTRFEILRDEWNDPKVPGKPIGIKFEKQGSLPCSLYLDNTECLLNWKIQLQKRINERGFHTLFKPIKKIGKGNFASVYLAQRLEDKKLVAVKAFSKQSTFSQEKGKQSLINQMKLMRQLDHKNLMKLFAVFQSENSIYITVQLLEGGQLFNKIQSRHKFTPEQTRKIMHGLLSGIQSMHQKRIMHRDLKPQNILLRSSDDYEAVIADFGLATWADEEEYLFVRCGTPGYVAPQIINIKDLKTKSDPICDVFSAGLIFHILLMGKSIFPGRQYNQVLVQNRACDFNLFASEYTSLDANAHNLMIRMLDKNPKTRIPASEALKHPYFASVPEEKNNANSMQVEEEFYSETPLMKKQSNTMEVQSIKLSIKPSIHEDFSAGHKMKHQFSHVPKSISKENNQPNLEAMMIKPKKLNSLNEAYRSKEKKTSQGPVAKDIEKRSSHQGPRETYYRGKQNNVYGKDVDHS